jgi:hypothetical protein
MVALVSDSATTKAKGRMMALRSMDSSNPGDTERFRKTDRSNLNKFFHVVACECEGKRCRKVSLDGLIGRDIFASTSVTGLLK